MTRQHDPRSSARSRIGSGFIALILGWLGLGGTASAQSADWFTPDADGVVTVRNAILVRGGRVFDGKGMIFQWDPADPNNECSQREGMDEVFKLYEGATLRNVVIRYSPDGLKVLGDNVLIENVVFEEVCEDALVLGSNGSKRRVKNTIIRNSEFRGGTDKQIQINNAENVFAYNNKHIGGGAGMRVGKGVKNVYLWNTTFDGTKHGVRYQDDVHIGTGPIAVGGTVTRKLYYDYEKHPANLIEMSEPPALPFDADAR